VRSSLPRLRGRVREGAKPHDRAYAMDERDQIPKWRVSDRLRDNTKALRRNMTDAERIIWYNVRAHRFQGVSFRRQTPIGPYVVDFVCYAAKLIIELDGGQHFEPGTMPRDARRDACLKAQGFRVLRFNNHEVMKNKAGVLEMIAEACGQAPSLALPRKRRRGQGSANSRGIAHNQRSADAQSAPPLKRRADGRD
jgi:very-short-patch-repair endonuclease